MGFGPPGAPMSRAAALCARYHAATVYTPRSVARHGSLDFSQQPSPFKSWYQARQVPLKGGPAEPAIAEPGPLDEGRLGRLLHHTYGVTLVREFPGMSMFYRAAPSAGGLYPAELYVAVRHIEGIPDGIHDYDARKHALTMCWEGDFGDELSNYSFGHPALKDARAVLIGTGVYERSAWRYQDRAYRRVLLDTGHMIGNAVLAGWRDGQRVVPIPDFHDEAIESMLLLDPQKEGVLMLAALTDRSAPAVETPAPLRSPVHADAGTPEEGGWIPAAHAAGKIQAAEVAGPPSPVEGPTPLGPAVALGAEALAGGVASLETIRRRRSTRSFSQAALPLGALGRVLAHTYPPAGHPEPPAPLVPGLLETHVVVANVTGLAAGVHRYDQATHSLLPVRLGNPRQALYECCLHQDLARDCAAAVIHTFDLHNAVERLGERAYRTAHLEAGLLGQRLNLGALQLGFGASGIGGFFDEFVTHLLQIPPTQAVAYITTLGTPA